MRRILLVLTTVALLAVFEDIHEDNDLFDNDDEDIEDEEDEDEGDEIDDIDVEDAFIDDGDICVPVVITFEDGSTDTDIECEDVEDVVDEENVDLEDAFFSV